MNAREVLSLIFKDRQRLIVCIVIPIILGVVYWAIAVPKYEAEAKILVRTGREMSSGEENRTGTSSTEVQATRQEVINSEIEIINSGDSRDKVIREFGVETLFPPNAIGVAVGFVAQPIGAAVAWVESTIAGLLGLEVAPAGEKLDDARKSFDKALDVEPVKNADVITVSFGAPSPALAVKVLDRYLDLYEQKHVQVYSRPIAGVLQVELSGLENKLQATEQELANYRIQRGVFDPANEQSKLIETQSNLIAAAAQLRSHVVELQARLDALIAMRKKTPEDLQVYSENETTDSVTKARTELLDLQVQRSRAAYNFKPSSTTMRTLDDQIAAVQKFLEDEQKRFSGRTRRGRNPIYDEIDAEIVRAKAEIGPEAERAQALEHEEQAIEGRLKNIEDAQTHIEALERTRDALQDNVKAYHDREQEARLSQDLDREKIVNTEVIQHAVAPDQKTSPKIIICLVVGLAAGLVVAGGRLGMVMWMRSTYIVPEEIERRTKVPVIVTLPDRRVA